MNYRQRAEAILCKGGMPAREMRSTVQEMTPEIRSAIPDHGSFGLSGAVGSGKTGAIAALMLAAVEAELGLGTLATEPVSLHAGGYRWPALPVQWVNWPETVNRLRVLSANEGGVREAAEIVDRLAKASRLVLDDLGAERIRGDYAADWAISQLDLILDRRYADFLPVWYTTSLSMPEFVKRYGRRMIERLAVESPLIELPRLDSRRLAAHA